jgi:hypothetical protein
MAIKVRFYEGKFIWWSSLVLMPPSPPTIGLSSGISATIEEAITESEKDLINWIQSKEKKLPCFDWSKEYELYINTEGELIYANSQQVYYGKYKWNGRDLERLKSQKEKVIPK